MNRPHPLRWFRLVSALALVISGQAPDFQTGQDCEYFSRFLQFGGETFGKWTKYGQLSGDGCVYPRYVRTIASPGTKSSVPYNHYSLLKTMETIFGLPPLGDARQPQVHAFGADVFSG